MRNVVAIATLTATALATGCVQPADDRIGDVLPTADTIKIRLPDSTAMTAPDGAIGAQQLAVLGQLADYYVVTRTVTRDLNFGAGWVLFWVHAIVQFPPTTRAGNVYTWGPGSDPLDPAEHRLVVTDNADGTYTWSLDGRSKTAPGAEFEAIIYGVATPGAIPHHGTGHFTIDFDAAERVNPVDNDAIGAVHVEYDLENDDGTQATLDMAIDSRVLDANGDEQPVHYDYHYAENDDRSGDFEFAIHGDLDDDGSLVEDAVIRSRWLTTGAGRADVRVRGGDLIDLVVEASECWDTAFARVFYTDNQGWQPTEGDVSACAFADADLPAE